MAFAQVERAAVARNSARDKSKDQSFFCGKMGHHSYNCSSVSTKIRDKHMASRKKDLDEKQVSKVGT